MILASFGTFDVKNYGDSLFPLIVEQKLGAMFSEFVHVSPVGGQAYEDVPECISVQEFMKQRRSVDAVVLAGGNIVHARRTPLPEYRSVQRTAYSSLWACAAKAAARSRAPLLINSPGVPARTLSLTGPAMRMAFDQAAYASVRDEQSQKNLGYKRPNKVKIVPDTALLLSETLGDSVIGEKRDEVVIHINERYANSDAASMARLVEGLSKRLQLTPHFVGIGACHGDDLLATAISAHMRIAHRITEDPTAVHQVASAIANARLYIGSSLHGFITAVSYSVPAVIVADNTQQHKFIGLLQQLNSQNRIFESWESVSRAAKATDSFDQEGLPEAADIPSQFLTTVDYTAARERIRCHWGQIAAAVESGPYATSISAYIPKPAVFVAGLNVLERAPSRISTAASKRKSSDR